MLLSLMLGLIEAMKRAERSQGNGASYHWAIRVPLDARLAHPERCWLWGESPLAN